MRESHSPRAPQINTSGSVTLLRTSTGKSLVILGGSHENKVGAQHRLNLFCSGLAEVLLTP